MTKKILLPLLQVTIRRDANTITPITVPPHELTILRGIFNKENVQEGKSVGTVELDADEEHSRLSAKYDPQEVARVYGDDGGERLRELMVKSEVKPAKAVKEPVSQ